ncbi:unnamed protein product [Blepharisma stoltei]|uniref:Uncharacterized protein n=1 Tax=Blepharisma stoltei TaxID=1481888 RepID=A0AAU9JRS3_9CILI|nr:unnamed protein product [Blepharisma stoltei]
MSRSASPTKSDKKLSKVPVKSYRTYLDEDIGYVSRKDHEFLSVVSLGLKQRVEQMIKKGHHNLLVKDKSGNNAVHIAAKKNDMDLLRMICDTGVPASLRKRGSNNVTPFMIAAKHGCKDSLSYLHTEARVDVHQKDSQGQNALFYAVIGGSMECLKYLIEVAKLNYKITNNENGNTLLHTASLYGHIHLVRYCCETLRMDPHRFNLKGKSPLFLGIEANSLIIVTYLHSVWGVNIFLPNDDGMSPLAFSASDSKFFGIFSYLATLVSPESLVEGDPLLTKSLQHPPITAQHAALSNNNQLAIDFISKKTIRKRRVYLLWMAEKSPLLQNIKSKLIEGVLSYI